MCSESKLFLLVILTISANIICFLMWSACSNDSLIVSFPGSSESRIGLGMRLATKRGEGLLCPQEWHCIYEHCFGV